MWPMGHVAIAYLGASGYLRFRDGRTPTGMVALVVAFGAIFPDVIDKPLAWQLGILPTGRSLTHSLLVLLPLCVLVFLLARRFDRGTIAVAFSIGAVSHSLVDAFPALWRDSSATFLLWPALAVEPYIDGPPTILELLLNNLASPYFHLEFVLLGMAIVLWRADGYPGVAIVRRQVRTIRAAI